MKKIKNIFYVILSLAFQITAQTTNFTQEDVEIIDKQISEKLNGVLGDYSKIISANDKKRWENFLTIFYGFVEKSAPKLQSQAKELGRISSQIIDVINNVNTNNNFSELANITNNIEVLKSKLRSINQKILNTENVPVDSVSNFSTQLNNTLDHLKTYLLNRVEKLAKEEIEKQVSLVFDIDKIFETNKLSQEDWKVLQVRWKDFSKNLYNFIVKNNPRLENKQLNQIFDLGYSLLNAVSIARNADKTSENLLPLREKLEENGRSVALTCAALAMRTGNPLRAYDLATIAENTLLSFCNTLKNLNELLDDTLREKFKIR